uniref:Uncharacterized protein n=1 Tax=Oncorhynchus kisutch TaxID=8019 RepID=A0A8C7F0X6_ONCKI
MKGMAKDMFYFGYDNYMKYAFPEDELNPIDCQGRDCPVQLAELNVVPQFPPWCLHYCLHVHTLNYCQASFLHV